MDPELQKQAVDIFRRAIEAGATPEQASSAARAYLDRSGGPSVSSRGPGVVGGTLRSAAQGATLGLSDELRGGVQALGALVPGGRSPGEAFSEGVEAERAALSRFGEDHPWLRTGADLAGGVGTALLTGGLALGGRGAVTAGRLARIGAAEGAVVGGVEGAARAEGGLGERAASGAGGAAAGSVLGGLGGALVPVLSRAGATGAGAVVGGGTGYAVEGDATGTGAGVLAGATAGRLGGRLGSKLARAIGEAGPATGAERAAVVAGRALGREGITPGQLTRLADEGVDANLLTLSGRGGVESPVQRLGRGAQSIPSRGSREITSFLGRESDEAPLRIRSALQRESGLEFENIPRTLDEIAEQQQAAARPLYQRAHAQEVPPSVLGDIDIASDDVFREAYESGRRAAAREGIEFPTPEQIAEGAPIPVQAIDFMKSNVQELVRRGLDSGRRVLGREASAINRQLSEVLENTDELVPEFGQARAAWAGEARAQDMIEAARGGSRDMGLKKFTTETPEAIERAMQGMSPSERDFYRRGALDSIREMLEKRQDTRADLSRLLIGRSGGEAAETDLRKRLRLLFDSDEAMERFVRSMLDERGRAQARGFVLGGSPTQRIAAEQADLQSVSGGGSPSSLKGLVVETLRERVGNFLQSMTEGTVDELAPLLTEPVSESGPAILQGLDRFGDRLRTRARIGGRAAGTLAPAVGAVLSDDPTRRRR